MQIPGHHHSPSLCAKENFPQKKHSPTYMPLLLGKPYLQFPFTLILEPLMGPWELSGRFCAADRRMFHLSSVTPQDADPQKGTHRRRGHCNLHLLQISPEIRHYKWCSVGKLNMPWNIPGQWGQWSWSILCMGSQPPVKGSCLCTAYSKGTLESPGSWATLGVVWENSSWPGP